MQFSPQGVEPILLGVLTLIQFCHTLDFVILMPLGPQLMRLFQLSLVEFGLLVSAYTAAASISGFLVALFIDRFDRKKAILSLFAVFTAATLLCALSGSFQTLLLARMLAGASGGVLQALIFAVVGDVIPESRRGRATGVILSAFSLSSILGIPLGLFIANRYDWQAPFLLLAAVCLAGWFLGSMVLPSMRSHLPERAVEKSWGEELKRVSGVVRVPRHRMALGLNLAIVFGMFSYIPYLNPHLIRNVGLQESELSWVYLVGGVFTILGARLTGWLSDRHGKYQVFRVAALLALLPILGIAYLPVTPLPGVLIVTTIFMVLMNARMVPATSMVTSAARADLRGAFLSVNTSLQHVTMSLASVLGGTLVSGVTDAGGALRMDRLGWVAGAFGLVAIPLAKGLSDMLLKPASPE
jgi:predicted MFS family arabinose efflux permease